MSDVQRSGYSSKLSIRFLEAKLLALGRFELGLRSEFTRFGLRRELSKDHESPSAKIPIAVRPLEVDDLPAILPEKADHLPLHEQVLISWRRSFLKKVPTGCYVGIDLRTGTPCYVQWMLSSSQNPLIRTLGGFPDLEPQEALLENAFTPVAYRGLGVMSAAMAKIAERAVDIGAEHVLTFVGDDNIASLKGCQRAGFYPHLINRRVRFAFGLINSNTFERLPDDDPRRAMIF